MACTAMPPSFAAQAKGQDIISLVIVLPTLVITAMLASRVPACTPHFESIQLLVWLF
jgi:hypothetical protein